jgi:hypothetical protein
MSSNLMMIADPMRSFCRSSVLAALKWNPFSR